MIKRKKKIKSLSIISLFYLIIVLSLGFFVKSEYSFDLYYGPSYSFLFVLLIAFFSILMTLIVQKELKKSKTNLNLLSISTFFGFLSAILSITASLSILLNYEGTFKTIYSIILLIYPLIISTSNTYIKEEKSRIKKLLEELEEINQAINNMDANSK